MIDQLVMLAGLSFDKLGDGFTAMRVEQQKRNSVQYCKCCTQAYQELHFSLNSVSEVLVEHVIEGLVSHSGHSLLKTAW